MSGYQLLIMLCGSGGTLPRVYALIGWHAATGMCVDGVACRHKYMCESGGTPPTEYLWIG